MSNQPTLVFLSYMEIKIWSLSDNWVLIPVKMKTTGKNCSYFYFSIWLQLVYLQTLLYLRTNSCSTKHLHSRHTVSFYSRHWFTARCCENNLPGNVVPLLVWTSTHYIHNQCPQLGGLAEGKNGCKNAESLVWSNDVKHIKKRQPKTLR